MAISRSIFSRFRSRSADGSEKCSNRHSPNFTASSSVESRIYRMMLMGAFAAHPGNGLVISALRRAQVLRDCGNEVEIVAFPFDARFRHAAKTVAREFNFGDTIKFRNPFAELCGDDYTVTEPLVNPLPIGDNWEIVPDPKDDKVRRAYRGGIYQQFIYSDAKTRVVFIDYLGDDSKRYKRSWHDSTGRIVKIEHFNAENKSVNVQYIHTSGIVCLKAKVDPSGKEYDFEMSLPDGRESSFESLPQLEAWWLVNFVLDENAWNPIISEYGFRVAVFEEATKHRDISVAYALHNLHLTAPYTYGSAIKPELVPFFENIRRYDAVVALTEEQRLDLIRQLGISDNVFVIPHHFEPRDYSTRKVSNSVVMSSRIIRYKGHFDALSVWPRILDAVPDAILNIYGTGPDLEHLRSEVKAAGLEASVLVHGFEKDVVRKVSEAEIAILPSQFEGFPLSLIETMSVGTVPVVYDFKYGARAMVDHGVNGFITERSNAIELADSVIFLMKNPEVLNAMSVEARKIVDKYSAQKLADNWTSLFNELERRRP